MRSEEAPALSQAESWVPMRVGPSYQQEASCIGAAGYTRPPNEYRAISKRATSRKWYRRRLRRGRVGRHVSWKLETPRVEAAPISARRPSGGAATRERLIEGGLVLRGSRARRLDVLGAGLTVRRHELNIAPTVFLIALVDRLHVTTFCFYQG